MLKRTVITAFILGFAFSLVVAVPKYMPGTGHLKGFIYKPDDKTPFWGAQVLLQDVKTEEIYRSNVTDSTGDYSLINIPGGDYRVFIMAKARAYTIKQVEFKVKIQEKKTSFLSFSLEKPVSAGFFLFQPCCFAKLIAGVVIIPPLIPPKEEEPASPVQR